jgi:AbrB family looped-hinge helix DNA binding protein
MAATTIKMGKRGTLVLPAKLRKQFGLEDGSLLNVEEIDGGIGLRPTYAYEAEIWSPQRKAYLLLINTLTKEEYDRVAALLVDEGIDPTDIPYLDPGYRMTLPTDEEFEEHRKRMRDEGAPEKKSA